MKSNIMRTEKEEALLFLRQNGIENPDIAVILGTGLGKLVDQLQVEQSIPYGKIPHFPVSTVEFHRGLLICARFKNKKLLLMQGRFHYYEGYNMQQIVFPIHLFKSLGIKYLLISNASGTVNPDFKKGELMLITDHINQFWNNPLIGQNDDTTGPRFPDMSHAYSPELINLFLRAAKMKNVKLHQGVYAALSGPSLETRAEYRYLQFIGADVVGMSTIPEVIAANYLGLPVAAVSVITDECNPDNLSPINLEDILATAAFAEIDLIRLFEGVLELS
ncbi:MAG TPA: purine-nucleoside phosphorylase [Bacteroidales bacterium]|nr:purine-nucleoside phosphorylase [Bacteroidales bacterium]